MSTRETDFLIDKEGKFKSFTSLELLSESVLAIFDCDHHIEGKGLCGKSSVMFVDAYDAYDDKDQGLYFSYILRRGDSLEDLDKWYLVGLVEHPQGEMGADCNLEDFVNYLNDYMYPITVGAELYASTSIKDLASKDIFYPNNEIEKPRLALVKPNDRK